jgi:hypothetical protein
VDYSARAAPALYCDWLKITNSAVLSVEMQI